MVSKVHYGVVLWTGELHGVSEAVDLGIAAEQAGWDGVFVPDELSAGYSDPWTVLSAVAQTTTRIRLGTWITPLPHQQPWRVAHTAAAVDQLSGGRLMLGVGLGAPNEHSTFGGSYEPQMLGRKYDEVLDVIEGLWSGQPFSYSGDFFRVEEATLAVTPVQQPRVPIVMGCWWPNKKPFMRAARWDGIMPFWPSLLQGGSGPQGEQATGDVQEELQALMTYYRSLVDDPGEIVIPDRPEPRYRQLALELGATWLLTTKATYRDEIKRGPQRI